MTEVKAHGESERRREWSMLFTKLERSLSQFGKGDPCGEGDFVLVDDDYGTWQHKIECTSRKFFESMAIEQSKVLLSEFAGPWQIIFVFRSGSGELKVRVVTRAGISHQSEPDGA